MTDTDARDEKAFELRRQGKSFAAIAKLLGYKRSPDANAAFNRSLRRRPAVEHEGLRQEELERLEALAKRVRANTALAPEDLDRRLRAVDRLRATLLAD